MSYTRPEKRKLRKFFQIQKQRIHTSNNDLYIEYDGFGVVKGTKLVAKRRTMQTKGVQKPPMEKSEIFGVDPKKPMQLREFITVSVLWGIYVGLFMFLLFKQAIVWGDLSNTGFDVILWLFINNVLVTFTIEKGSFSKFARGLASIYHNPCLEQNVKFGLIGQVLLLLLGPTFQGLGTQILTDVEKQVQRAQLEKKENPKPAPLPLPPV